MSERARRKWIVGVVLAIGAAAFLTGINWGLPSKNIDPFLFPDASRANDSTQSFGLSGAGIIRLVGGWKDEADRGSDVAQHPLGDRSKPIVLIENPTGFTLRQILDAGDKRLPTLRDQQQKLWQRVTELSQNPADHPDDLHNAQMDYLHSGDAIGQYIEKYNQDRIPDYEQTLKRDGINRARILMRYRLYSNQPDEMITFRALGSMHPGSGDFDPRMYQYGGLWIYPIGALIKGASLINLVVCTNDISFYLDRPEEFAKFYIVARAYSAAWGLVGALAVFALTRRFTGAISLGVIASLCFIAMPVVLDLAHEAKPHLPGAVLVLLAVLSAIYYVDTGKNNWWIITSILCGAAAGMILSDLSCLILIPALGLARRDKPAKAIGICFGGILIAAAVYFATNPFVLVHLFHNRAVLTSNLGNSSAMYDAGSLTAGLMNAIRLLVAGMSLPLLIVGIPGIILLQREAPTGRLLMTVALASFAPFVIFASGKSGEYARFGIVTDIALMIAAMVVLGRICHCSVKRMVFGLMLVGATAIYSIPYEKGFLADCTDYNTRLRAARYLSSLPPVSGTVPELDIFAEPAPYSLPPVDLYRWKIVLFPVDATPAGTSVKIADDRDVWKPSSTPISWANKSLMIEQSTGINGGVWQFNSISSQ